MVNTVVGAGVKVRPWVYSTIYVANEVIRLLQEIVQGRGLPPDYLSQYYQLLSDGFRYWIAVRDLDRVILEVFDPQTDRLVERYDIVLDYSRVADEATYETLIEKVGGHLAELRALQPDCRYGLLAVVKPGAAKLPGWGSGACRDDSHLQKQRVGQVIGSPRIGATLEYRG